MKKNTNKVWLTAVLLSGAFSLRAQELPQPNPQVQGPEHLAKGPHHPLTERGPGEHPIAPGGEKQKLIKLSTIKGSVINPVANDRFEFNGLLIKTISGNIEVKFPPHLGEQILDKAKNGTSVTITGDERVDPQGKKIFQLNTIEVNGTSISDAPPVAPVTKDTQEQKNISSTIKEINYGPEKKANGFTLASGERIAIPAHIAQQLASELKVNQKIAVNGFLEPKRPGIVYSQKVTLIRAQTLNINGQTYLVR